MIEEKMPRPSGEVINGSSADTEVSSSYNPIPIGLSDVEKDNLLAVLYLTMFVVMFTITQMGPYYEPVAERNFDLSKSSVGLIMAVSTGSGVIGCLMTPWVATKATPFTIFIVVEVLHIISSFGFACVNWFDDTTWFTVTSIVFKVMQGLSRGVAHCFTFALMPQIWEGAELARNVGNENAAITFGIFGGPVIGGLLNHIDYFWNFLSTAIFGVILLVMTLAVFPPLPKLNLEGRRPWHEYLNSRSSLFACAIIFIMVFSQMATMYFMSKYYEDEYDVAINEVGFILAISPLLATFANLKIHEYIGVLSWKWVFPLVSLIVFAISDFFYVPAYFFPQNMAYPVIGFVLGGLAMAFAMAPSYMILLEAGSKLTGDTATEVGRIISTAYTSTYLLASTFSSIYGVVIDRAGFHAAFNAAGITLPILAAVLFFFCKSSLISLSEPTKIPEEVLGDEDDHEPLIAKDGIDNHI